MNEKELELLYLKFFYQNIDLGEDSSEKVEFINSQFRALGLTVPEKYDVYKED